MRWEPYQVGDTVQFIGTTNQYVVKAVDSNFEGAGEAVGLITDVTFPPTIEWYSASLVEKIDAMRIPPGYGVSSKLNNL